MYVMTDGWSIKKFCQVISMPIEIKPTQIKYVILHCITDYYIA